MEIPVYLFTGFLDAGKTKFIQETLEDARFNQGQPTLLLLCEEGMEEYDPSSFAGKNVTVHVVEEESDMTPAYFEGLEKKYKFERVMLEYNGMWMLDRLAQALPEHWIPYQEFMFAEYATFENYNANMRGLMVDKLRTCELCVVNRFPKEADPMPIHKIIRGVNRRCDIAYEYTDGQVQYDEIQDPLPFDLNAPVIEIADRDFAYWYRHLSEEMGEYKNKTVRFKAMIAKNEKLPEGAVVVGRNLMTCCVEDIGFAGLLCYTPMAKELNQQDWVMVTARIELKYASMYRRKGPVLTATEITPAEKPEQEVATFD